MSDPLELWYWIIPSDAYPFSRQKSTWRMTEEEASLRYGTAAEKVDGSCVIRHLTWHGGATPQQPTAQVSTE